MLSGTVLPASRTHIAMNSGMFCSNRSAARSRAAARGSATLRVPCGLRAQRGRNGLVDLGGACVAYRTDDLRRVRRIADRLDGPSSSWPETIGAASHGRRDTRCMRSASSRSAPPVGEIEAGRIAALRLVDVDRQRNARVRRLRQLVHRAHRVGHDALDRLVLVDDAVHERRVGAVLEQPPHQVRQQVLVLAHRRIDAARHAESIGASSPRRTAPRPCRAGAGTRTRDRSASPGATRRPPCARCAWRTADTGGPRPARRSASHRQRYETSVFCLRVKTGKPGRPRSCARLTSASQYAPFTSRTCSSRDVSFDDANQVAQHVRRALLVGLHREPAA